ncbi:MAG TPA: hypothetical protein PL155_09020 [Candidatus Omnitrophota bacterium]|nr:hypothetical protein [Candidatus Omnitrophota bacterium]HPD85403.1 hypothetical protein [Candidatus Omnitrophota bacterium]HRZ04096.1 hypothetical protein [Candidatus Omnitrophota bacterium]
MSLEITETLQRYSTLIPPLLFSIVLLSIMLPRIISDHRRTAQALKVLADYLQGTIPRFSLYSCVSGKFQELEVNIALIPAQKSTPSCLRISAVKSSQLKLRIYRKNPLSFLLGTIGVGSKVTTGDETLDKEFAIFSNDPSHATAYLMNVKNALTELCALGFEAAFLTGKKIVIEKKNYHLEADLAQPMIETVLSRLSLLSSRLPF